MSSLTLNENGVQDKTTDLINDSNSDNTVTNSFYSNQSGFPQLITQEMLYQQPKTYAVSCEELKKLKKSYSQDSIVNTSPSSLQLKSSSNAKNMNQSLLESPTSLSTVTSTSTSRSSKQSQNGSLSSKESSKNSASSYNGITILGQPIILTPENKKLLKKLSKAQLKNGPKLTIINNPAFPTPLSSKKNSLENGVNLENQRVLYNVDEEEKETNKEECEKEEEEEEDSTEDTSSSESETEEKTQSTVEESDDESVDDRDFSHIWVNDEEDEEEDDDDVDKELTYPMREGFVLRDSDEEADEEKKEMVAEPDSDAPTSHNKESSSQKKKKKSKSKRSKGEKKSKKESSQEEIATEEVQEAKTELDQKKETNVEENTPQTVDDEEDEEDEEEISLFQIKNKLDTKKMNRLSIASSTDFNNSAWNLPAPGLPVPAPSSDISGPIITSMNGFDSTNPYYIPSGQIIPPPPSSDYSAVLSNRSGVSSQSGMPIDTNTSFWVPPPPSQADSNQLVVNIQGQQVPYHHIQQAYSFIGKSQATLQPNSATEKLKSMGNSHKLVNFNSQEMTTMPISSKVKINPPILETGGGPKGATGVPSKTSQRLKAKQSLETAALKRQSWCNVNSDILNNVQTVPGTRQRNATYPQPYAGVGKSYPLALAGHGHALYRIPSKPLVSIQMPSTQYQNHPGTNPNDINSKVVKHKRSNNINNNSNSNSNTNSNSNSDNIGNANDTNPNKPHHSKKHPTNPNAKNQKMGPYLNLPNPALINLPYGTIINTNAYTTHNSINPHSKKDARGEKKDEFSSKELARQRIERWAEESKATMCHVKENGQSAKARRSSMSSSEALKLMSVPSYGVSKKSKSFDNIKQMFTIEEDSAALALAHANISDYSSESESSYSSSSGSSSSSDSSTSSDSESDSRSSISEEETSHRRKHSSSKRSHQHRRRHRRHQDHRDHRDRRDRRDRRRHHHRRHHRHHRDDYDDPDYSSSEIRKQRGLMMKHSMDSSLKPGYLEHSSRQVSGYAPPSPSLYSVSAMGPVEMINADLLKKSRRRSYSPGINPATEYPDLMMSQMSSGANYYPGAATPNFNAKSHNHNNLYGVKYNAHPQNSNSYYPNPRIYM